MSATEFYTKSKVQFNYYKLIIWKGANGCVIVALGSVLAGLSNENWKDMDSQARFLFLCGIALSTLKALDMLLDQSLSKATEKPPQSATTQTQ